MAKVSGSYESVVRGVSEQAPQTRRSGQHFAQVNMVSDPVRGLCRRHGSIMQDERLLSSLPAQYEALLADTAGHKVITFFVAGNEYDLIARTTPSTLGEEGFAFCFDKDARQFIDIQYGDDALLTTLFSGGISASVNVGRYLYLAGTSIIPVVANTAAWDDETNQSRLVGWIRSGAYSRNFSITLTKMDNTSIVGSYKTKASSYPGVLDTSDIDAGDPEYQKKVNDRTNEYNSAQIAWIGEAAEDITPENIAGELVAALIAAGVDPADISQNGAYVIVDSPDYKELAADDAGDGSLVRGVGNTVDNVDLVSAQHYIGKVIKVAPDGSNENAVYLKAFAKDGTATGFGEVVWREAAGYEMRPQSVFCMATIEGGVLYLSGSASGLGTLAGIDVPDYKVNSVGDDLSSPLPDFFGRRITYMGIFQDRLVIGSGATLLFSRPGDYLNWFRKSVLTVNDADPWEGYALGSEDDTIYYGTTYDRNLLLYGQRFQYSVSGRQPFSPKTASIVIASAYEDAVDAAPQASGNFVYYAKFSGRAGKEVSSLHQVQAGIVADNSESYTASQQLDTYLRGKPHEILTMTAPNMVLLRTTADRTKVFTYSYLDNPGNGERLFDAWSLWQWSINVGDIMGLSKHEGDILVYTLKRGLDKFGLEGIWVAAEQFTRDAAMPDYPHLDSLRPLADVITPSDSSFINTNSVFADSASVAIEAEQELQFIGEPLSRMGTFIENYPTSVSVSWAGLNFPAYFTPTNPYAKDRNGQPILAGRLTLGKVIVAVQDTGGMQVSKVSRGTETQCLNFTGRILGAAPNLIGRQPIVASSLAAFIGGEVRECQYTISAVKWLPLAVTSIEWTGQFFFNTKRA